VHCAYVYAHIRFGLYQQEHDVSEYDEDAFEDLRNGPLGVKVSSRMLEQVLQQH
jgi:hypothetical protein